MKYSLADLVVLLLVAALCINVATLFVQSRSANDHCLQLREQMDVDVNLAPSSDDQEKDLDILKKRNEKLLTSRQSLLGQFESFANKNFQIEPVSNQFSIIGKPEPQPGYYLRTFRVYVPENMNLSLRMLFETANPPPNRSASEFLVTDEAVVPLPKGWHSISFRFRPVEIDQDSLQHNIAEVLIDNEVVIGRDHRTNQNPGFSSSTPSFESQRNYAGIPKPINLIRYHPSSALKQVRLEVINSAEVQEDP